MSGLPNSGPHCQQQVETIQTVYYSLLLVGNRYISRDSEHVLHIIGLATCTVNN